MLTWLLQVSRQKVLLLSALLPPCQAGATSDKPIPCMYELAILFFDRDSKVDISYILRILLWGGAFSPPSAWGGGAWWIH